MRLIRFVRWTPRRFGLRSCSLASALAVALVGQPIQVHAAPSADVEEIERLYREGQEYYEAAQFVRAADAWTRLLNLIPESGEKKSIRESVIINILDAHIQAYKLVPDSTGEKNILHLLAAKTTLEAYYKDFKAVHGDMGIEAAVQEKAALLDAELEQAKKEGNGPIDDDPPPPQPPQQSNGSAIGLIAGGSVLSVLGLGAISLIAIGRIQTENAEDDYEEARAREAQAPTDEAEMDARNDQDEATARGNQGVALLIAGSIISPVLLAGGIAMLVLGVKAQKASSGRQAGPIGRLRLSPAFTSRQFVGFTLSGRF